MKLLLLGTTGYHPTDSRHTACLMLPELGIVLDAGTALYRVRDYLQTTHLDIFLTHAHLDHVIGLTFLFDILYERPLKDVRVHGEPAKLQAIDDHLLAPELFPVKLPCQFVPLATETMLAGGGRLTTFPLEHPGGSLGFRLDWPGHSMAYVTDTVARVDAPYVAAIRDVDLLVHECYFPDAQAVLAGQTGHSCTTPVMHVARAANAKRLVLVHVNPLALGDDPLGLAAARRLFSAAEMGYDRQMIEF